MNIHLTGHHLDITPSLKEYIQTKLAKIFHHFDHVIDAKVTLTVNKLEILPKLPFIYLRVISTLNAEAKVCILPLTYYPAN